MSKRNSKSAFRSNEPEKRLAEYKETINKALNKYAGDKSKFVTKMAKFILLEVRNEREFMKEFVEELEEVYDNFTVEDK